jgi:hypothetical protein
MPYPTGVKSYTIRSLSRACSMNSAKEPAEQVVHITQGDSCDHRPDLNQVRLELIIEHQTGMLS